MSKWTWVYIFLSSLIVTTFVTYRVTGWEWGDAPREHLPASARQSPGGYRSFHFWHSGFHGGK